MTLMQRIDRLSERRWYRNAAQIVAFLALALSIVCSVGVLAITASDSRQDAQRDADRAAVLAQQEALLDCIGEWANDLAGALPPVREASIKRDEAVTAYRAAQAKERAADDAITDLFIGALARTKEPTPAEQAAERSRAIELFQAKRDTAVAEAKAYRALDEAEQALEQARKANPYPPAPNFACSLGNGSAD